MENPRVIRTFWACSQGVCGAPTDSLPQTFKWASSLKDRAFGLQNRNVKVKILHGPPILK